MVEPDRHQMTIQYSSCAFACRITKAKDTLSVCNTHCFSKAKSLLERASVMLCIHCLLVDELNFIALQSPLKYHNVYAHINLYFFQKKNFSCLPVHFLLHIPSSYKVLVGKPEGKRPLARPRHRWEDNIKMDLQEVGGGCGNWMELA